MGKLAKRQQNKLNDIADSFRVIRQRFAAKYMTEKDFYKDMNSLENELMKFSKNN